MATSEKGMRTPRYSGLKPQASDENRIGRFSRRILALALAFVRFPISYFPKEVSLDIIG